LGDRDVIEDSSELEKYNHDWTKKYIGGARVAVRPSSTEQISSLLRYCNERGLAVVPQGGNTGLVGGSVPVFDELVLSLEKMSHVSSHDSVSGVLTVEAGCVLEAADSYVRERGFIMPLDLGAKGSCQLGGTIATNAGGLRLLRYGSLHGTVLGLESVLADGTILDGLNVCRKDNTGFDYKQLLIGSEGTLAVITKAVILTPTLPTSTNVALLAVERYESIARIFSRAKQDLGEILSAFEFWDDGSQKLLDEYMSAKLPIEARTPFYVLIETSGSNAVHDGEKMSNLLTDLQVDGSVVDGTMAQDETQVKSLWSLREDIPEACARAGLVMKYDISLPTAKMYNPVIALHDRLAKYKSVLSVIGYGHYGDGNIHVNVAIKNYDPAVVADIEPFLYELVSDARGSISAEHGVGVMKSQHLHYAKTSAEISILKGIKRLFDPKGILNPYKVLPS
jgi:FAD/FMN-containing dehydrogenase